MIAEKTKPHNDLVPAGLPWVSEEERRAVQPVEPLRVEREVYGRMPPQPKETAFEIVSEKTTEDRFATERRFRQWFRADRTGAVGVQLMKRDYGETIARQRLSLPWWCRLRPTDGRARPFALRLDLGARLRRPCVRPAERLTAP